MFSLFLCFTQTPEEMAQVARPIVSQVPDSRPPRGGEPCVPSAGEANQLALG